MGDFKKTTEFKRFWLNPADLARNYPVLVFVRGPYIGRNILLADDCIVFGRSDDAGIMINDPMVSRRHFQIDYDRGQKAYVVTDLDSVNGTYVNNNRIVARVIREGEKIFAGNTVLRFSRVDAIDMQYRYQIEQLMNIDDLTGLVVRRLFNEELDRMVAVARSRCTALSMLVMDMDGLKQINDTHGHLFGAYAITQIGQIIKQSLDGIGLACRFGGDEFQAFLPDTNLEDALNFAENLRKTIEAYQYVKDGVEIFPTLSIGVAAYQQGQTRDVFFQKADLALYKAKKVGKNCVAH